MYLTAAKTVFILPCAQTLGTSERELNLTRVLTEEELSLAVQALEDEDRAVSELDHEEVGI